ncbi:MAG: hypothetical protein CVU05_09600, partial [Bacteroidetes bacterium HGW-Bacteroidetes-21]
MTKLNYILKSLTYFKRQHFAVVLGVVISTAVLTGALIVGDSVRNSLKQMVIARLGNVQYVLQAGDRFVSAELALGISAKTGVRTAPIILTGGVATNPENELRLNKTQVLGVDSSFWQLSGIIMPVLKNEEVIVSSNLAEKLKLNVGDDLVLRVEKKSVIPLNSPYSSEAVPSVSLRLKVVAVADDKHLGRFGLKNNQVAPFNAFVSREYLSSRLEIFGKVNVILLAGNDNETPGIFNDAISEIWQEKDAGITVNRLDSNGNCEVTSDRIFIDKKISQSIEQQKSNVQKILTYLVNSIRLKDKTTPYSFVTALSGNYYRKTLKENECDINVWLAEDLSAKPGDTLSLTYFVIDSLLNLKEDSSRFVVRNIIPVRDSIINRSLMPKFPGFADAVSCLEWNSNMPIDMKKIRDKDEDYWNEFRGTPKMAISIEAGNKIWQNNFGDYTALRFNDKVQSTSSEKRLSKSTIFKNLNPGDLNLTVTEVKNEGRRAAVSGVDFGELFLSLSFFVIMAGIILTVMLYVLSLEARKTETGLLAGLGFSRKQILRLRINENAVSILIGSMVGVLIGILYTYGLMSAINTVWQDIVRTDMMTVFIQPLSLVTGFSAGFIISFAAIVLFTFRRLKKPVIGLIQNIDNTNSPVKRKKSSFTLLLTLTSLIFSLSLLGYSLATSIDMNAGLFLASGGLFMVGSLSWVYLRMGHLKAKGLTGLALKNISVNKSRSLTVVLLLAIGVFVVVITSANRNTFYGKENERRSGTGGYAFWAETTVPILWDLNTIYGREKAGLSSDIVNDSVRFAQCLVVEGDDASCLNLNQIENPGIIGVSPQLFDKQGSFSFATLLNQVDANNPWLELNASYGNHVIPAFADQTVITWGMLKKVGDTLTYVSESGEKLYLVLVGGLNASVFQGHILIADKYLRQYFPSVSGSGIMLVDVAENKR